MRATHFLVALAITVLSTAIHPPMAAEAGACGCPKPSGKPACGSCGPPSCPPPCPAPCRRRHRCSCLEPPRGMVLPSMPAATAPMMLPAPIGLAPASAQAIMPVGLQSFGLPRAAPARSPLSPFQPDRLRALADALEAQRGAAAAAACHNDPTSSSNGNGNGHDRASMQAPTPPPEETVENQVMAMDARLSRLEGRLGSLEQSTLRLLEKLEDAMGEAK